MNLIGTISASELHGGSGTDKLYVEATFTGDVNTLTLDGFEVLESGHLTGSDQNDKLDLTGVTGLDDSRFSVECGNGNDLIVDDDRAIGNQIAGDAGDDTLLGNGGNDNLDGGAGNDSLSGGADDDFLYGGLGNDTLDGGAGVDIASYEDAGTGVAVSLATTAAQNTRGAGIDRLIDIQNLVGSDFGDTLTGSAVANYLRGESGDDRLSGGDGDDALDGGRGNDVLNGGAGIDTARYLGATAGVAVNLTLTAGQNTGDAGIDKLIGIENLIGSAYADTLVGSADANLLEGGAGDDRLGGFAGDDTLAGVVGNDVLSGGAGNDTASYADATDGVAVKLLIAAGQNTLGAGIDRLISIENLIGSAFNDNLAGDAGANRLDGGAGDDVLTGGAGNDTLVGGAGVDTASYIDAVAGVSVNLTLTTAQNTGGAGIDTLDGIEGFRGSAFDDALRGNSAANRINGAEGNDQLFGYAGDDSLTGGAGRDKIYGGTGADTLDGGAGDDVLAGEAGRDILTGGLGADHFVFTAASDSTLAAAGRDLIRDFSHAQGDKIDLGAIDAVTGGNDNAFVFLGADAFTGVAGQLNVVASGTNCVVQGDVDGDKLADFAIQVTSGTPLVATDFVL